MCAANWPLVLGAVLFLLSDKIWAQNMATTTMTPRPSAITTTSTMYVGQFSLVGTVQNTTSLSQQASLQGGVLSVTVGPLSAAVSAAKNGAPSPATTSSAESATTAALYAALPPLNMACIGLQVYVCLFGRRMRMSGVRWFTLYYNIWNIYQVIIVSDTAELSPWRGWLSDARFVQNRAALELLTASVFPIGVVFLVPLLLLSHFCFCCPLRWLPWLLLFLILLGLGPVFIYNGGLSFTLPVVKGNATLAMGNGTANAVDLVEGYAFVSISLAWTLVCNVLVPLTLIALVFFLCYRLLNRYNPASNHPMRASRMVDLLLLIPFLLLVLTLHLPCFVSNLSAFFVVHLWPTVQKHVLPLLNGAPAAASAGPAPVGGGGGGVDMKKMMELLQYYNQIVSYKECTLMALPLAEFLASFLFIRMFREQYLALLSCYACYKGDKDGACGLCCCGGYGKKGRAKRLVGKVAPGGVMMVQPAPDPRMWAQPVMRVAK